MHSTRSPRKPVVVLPYRRSSGLFRRDGEYIADIQPDSGGRVIRRLGRDRERAMKLFEDIVSEIENGGENPLVTDFLLKTFLPTQRHLKAYGYSEYAVNGVVRFLQATETGLRVRDLKAYHVDRMRTYYAGADGPALSPRTLNAYTQKLSQALNHAADMGLVPVNPLARVRPLTVDNRRTKFLAMDDFVAIINSAQAAGARDMFLIAGLTGLRPSNVRLLTVDEVDGTRLRIAPGKMKNGRWGIVPISGYVQDVLGELRDGREPDGLVFPARGTQNTPKGVRNLQHSFKTVAKRAGREWASVYDLRHFFASQLAKQGATEQQIGRLLCHVGQSVTIRYVHHDIEDLRPFVDELSERYLQATGAQSLPYHRERQGEDRITV